MRKLFKICRGPVPLPCFPIFLLFTGFVFLLLFHSLPSHAENRHLIWSVEGGQSHVTLMGSIHTLRQDAYPLPEVYQKSYNESEILVFETDMAQMNDPATQARLLALGMFPEGETLFDHLSVQARGNLENALQDMGIPPAQFSRFKPWLCALTLVLLELQRLGYSPMHGLDMHFFQRTRQDGKPVRHLEPVEAQIQLLASMEKDFQEGFLLQSLQELEVLESMASRMTEAWRTGNAGELDEIIRAEFKGFPEVFERFLLRRNQEWLPRIEDLIRGNENALVIVGAGHLIGREGLIRMLEARGYDVKQQ